MKEKRYHLAMDERERSIMIHALNDYRNDLIDENRAPDAVEDLILKAANAPDKKVRVVERNCGEAR